MTTVKLNIIATRLNFIIKCVFGFKCDHNDIKNKKEYMHESFKYNWINKRIYLLKWGSNELIGPSHSMVKSNNKIWRVQITLYIFIIVKL